MLDFIKIINNDYADVLSLLASLIMVIVTIIYVVHTHRQVYYARQSAELVGKQIKIDKQPCVVPNVVDSFGSAFDTSSYVRKQLGFDVKLKNVGDSPAINIYTFADIELQFTHDAEGNKKRLSAALLPSFTQALSAEGETDVNILFETSEINALIWELGISLEKNWERIKNNPSQSNFCGANLIISVLFKNIMGQWYESTISYEIEWLEYLNPPEQKTKNLNENTIPPKEICVGDKYKAVLSSGHLAPFEVKMISEETVIKLLQKYREESPWLNRVLKNKSIESIV